VLILRHERTETIPGGAANCAVNLAALGARVALIGVVGEDEAGLALLSRLDACGVATGGVIKSSAVQTTTKVRILAGQLHSARQQVIRVDYEGAPLSDESLRRSLRSRLLNEAANAEAIIISDYNYGVADAEMVAAVREASSAGPKLPVLVDSRFRLSEFPGFTSGTPNEDEVEQLLGMSHTGLQGLEAAGEQLRARLGYRSLLITRGPHGMILLEQGAEPLHIEAVGALEPVDGTGAGDTVIAAYTLALASGATFGDAAYLANYAGGLVVMKRGTASVNQQELLSSVLRPLRD
jgi:rfaE bifunctional protein kinase chain/domain